MGQVAYVATLPNIEELPILWIDEVKAIITRHLQSSMESS